MSAKIFGIDGKPLDAARFAPFPQKSQLLEGVRAAAADGAKLTQTERIPVARHVDRMVVEAKASGLRMGQIREKLPEGLKPRDLERLRVGHRLTKQEIAKGEFVLKPSVASYLSAVEVLADMLGVARDDAVYEAFRDTGFRQSVSALSDDPAAGFTELLREMGSWISRRPPFVSYFQELSRYQGVFDETVGQFIDGQRRCLLPSYEDIETFVMWDETSSLPSVAVAELRCGHWTGKLLVELSRLPAQTYRSKWPPRWFRGDTAHI